MEFEKILKSYQARIVRLHAEIDALRAEINSLKTVLLSQEKSMDLSDEVMALLAQLGRTLDEISGNSTPDQP